MKSTRACEYSESFELLFMKLLRNESRSWFPPGKHIQIFFSFSMLEQAWKWRKQSLTVPGEGRDMEGVSHRSDPNLLFPVKPPKCRKRLFVDV